MNQLMPIALTAWAIIIFIAILGIAVHWATVTRRRRRVTVDEGAEDRSVLFMTSES